MTESVEQTQLDEAAIKSQIIKGGYIYFPDVDELYKVSPYKAVGNAEKLVTLGVKKWYSVNVATGEYLNDAGLAEIDADEKGRWFTVTKNNKDTDAALISSEPNNIYLNDETYIAAKAILEGQINEAASVFVVSGLEDYEGGRVLGVYTTKSAAEKAIAAYKAQVAADKKNKIYVNTDWDDYEIEEKPLNASIVLY